MGGRPRKPTAVLALNGAFERNPNRARIDEPVPTTTLGAAPKWLAVTAVSIWDEMAAEGFWLTGADRFLLEVAATHLDRFRRGAADSKDVGQLITVLNKLGFGPAERSKIKAPGAKQVNDDPFDQFK
jgi:hypothetical protein